MRQLLSDLRENWQWKLLSVVAAVMLWLALVDSSELTTTIQAPLEFKNFPVGLDFAGSIPSEVQLQLRGPQNVLAGQQRALSAVILDLGAVRQPGEYTFRVEDGLVGIPPNVQLVSAVPNQVRLVLEKHVRRQVPVRLRTSDLTNQPYRIVSSETDPASVYVSGPESRVEAVEAANTDLFDFGTIEEREAETTVEARLRVFVEDPRVKIESKPAVRVRIRLQRISD
jgi:YbbR domain-containing protein